MEVLKFHHIYLYLPSLSDPLKYSTVNTMKLNKKISWRKFPNSLIMVSELKKLKNLEKKREKLEKKSGKLDIYNLYFS